MDIAIHGGFDARMTEQPLQDFRHDPAFNCASCVGVPQSVHTEPFDFCFIAQFVQVGIIGAVFVRLAGAVVDKHQIPHTKVSGLTGAAIHIFQNLRKQFRFLPGVPLLVAGFQHIVCPVRQGNGSVAAS